MPDLSELLATEARRLQPNDPPPFEELLRARRARDRRNRVAGGSLLLLVVAGAALIPALLGAERSTTSTVAASSGQEVTVAGVLRLTGGPVGADHHGIPGVVVFESSSGQKTKATAGTDGTFAISVTPGRYTVTGTSPQYGDGHATCRTTDPITVGASGLAGVIVACPERNAATGGTTRPAGSVTARITLPATALRSGDSVSARITLNNDSGEEIHLTGCGAIYRVLLIGGGHHPTPSWPFCAVQITIPTGQSTYTVRVAATYSECSPNGGQGIPACLPDGSMPGIPPGRYAATTWGVSGEVPVPDPVSVTVTP